MPWNDVYKFESELTTALEAFDWPEAEKICDEIINRIKREPDPLPEKPAKNLMSTLRRKRCFPLMTQLAEAIIQSGTRTPQIRRQYAQALIDQGILAAGEIVLQSIITDPQGNTGEEMEARGLMGRIYKQLYVNNMDPKSEANRANLERALNEYLHVYRLSPQESLWHGINVVALAARARRDDQPLSGLPDVETLAREILDTLDRKENKATEPLPAWDVATALEAYVALGRNEDAIATAARYIHSVGADAFEIGSTIRQLKDVWQLSYEEPPGSYLLPICEAGYFKKLGAVIKGDPKKIRKGAEATGNAMKEMKGEGFEKNFGTDIMVTLGWYKKGLDQCNAIARVEKHNGKGHGTGWLVNAGDFFPDRQGVLLLTNEHVISNDELHPIAIQPEDAQANFQAVGEVFKIKEIVWSSPFTDLDATFVSLEGEPQSKPLKLHKKTMKMTAPPKAPPRMYIIGHPAGRDIEISLQDNYLLGCNERLLHYRTPTEPGNSGSPVFEPEDWRVVGLHHSGSKEMERIDGEDGTYEANEGISILAIQKKTREKEQA